jgi:hypothetical protein
VGKGLRRAKAWTNFSRARGTPGADAGALNRANLVGHRVGAADRHGQPLAKPKLANNKAQLGKPSMGTGVSPRGRARGSLARLPAGWMTGTTGAGHWQGRAAWAERERERGCVNWDERASAGVDGAQKEAGVCGRATWPGISACMRLLVHVGRGEGRAHRAVPRHSERESRRAGVTTRCTDEAGPRGRGGRGARGRRQLAPTVRPHWAERERERACGEGNRR